MWGQPLHIPPRGLWERSEIPAGSGAEPRPEKLVHFICHRTHLVKGKFNLFKNQLKITNQA